MSSTVDATHLAAPVLSDRSFDHLKGLGINCKLEAFISITKHILHSLINMFYKNFYGHLKNQARSGESNIFYGSIPKLVLSVVPLIL